MTEIIFNLNTREGLCALRKASGLRPTQTLGVGSVQLRRVVGREKHLVCGRAGSSAAEKVFNGGLYIFAIIFQHMHSFSPLYYLYPPTCFGPFGPSSGRYKLPRLQIIFYFYFKMLKYFNHLSFI
jgi:hypothetical protein